VLAEPVAFERRHAAVPKPIRRSPVAGLLALLCVTSFAGCQAAASLTLANREFLSDGITEKGAPFALVQGTRVRLAFTDSGLSATAGCNTFGASYRVEGGRLLIDGGAMTEMGCDDARNRQDQWLFGFLASEPSLRLAGTDLTLDGGGTIMRLVDRTIAEPDLSIVGPTWTVTSIIDGDAVSSVPAGATATLVFKADGTVQVHPGCNTGGGKWAAEGTGIAFKDVFLTKMACMDPAGSLESAVLAVINQGTVQASIRSNVLTLQAAGKGLQLIGS